MNARLRPVTISTRTGDTPERERRLIARDPGDILITTPESLYLILAAQARNILQGVETIIVDEIHALAPTKRGAHLMLTIERLCELIGRDPQRIGLSATQRPLEEIARFLGGAREGRPRPVTLRVDAGVGAAPFIDKETGSRWDVAGRAVEGALKGWTLEWLDGTQVNAVLCRYQTTIPMTFLRLLGFTSLPVAGEAIAWATQPVTPPPTECVFPIALSS